MISIRVLLVPSTLLCLSAAGAFAQGPAPYRCIDASGRSTYTNIKEEMAGKKCTPVIREVSVVPAQAPRPQPQANSRPSPVSPTANRAADRRKILEEELSDEQKRLAGAREKLAEQQSVRSGDERNYQRVLDRLKPYVEAVEQHEKNIEQLRRELSVSR